jgi:hypothetical protein
MCHNLTKSLTNDPNSPNNCFNPAKSRINSIGGFGGGSVAQVDNACEVTGGAGGSKSES